MPGDLVGDEIITGSAIGLPRTTVTGTLTPGEGVELLAFGDVGEYGGNSGWLSSVAIIPAHRPTTLQDPSGKRVCSW